MTEEPGAEALNYASYLALEEILGAQRPRSEEHDEMLFIVIHQVYELWFKQLLHELSHLQGRLEAGETTHSLHTLRRALTIFKVVVAQIDVLETMTPRQFTSFRARLDASSGFQSAQFRRLEALLGRRDTRVLAYYREGTPERAAIKEQMGKPSLYDSFLRYLVIHGYEPGKDVRKALLAVYHDDEGPAQVAERMVDLDEGLQEWRYRHVKMVERTIGDKSGTGGSSGAAYLRGTTFTPVFPDLWAIRSEL
ncbi:MAG TPA: tryptophan 2,3-dioxygenase family protein [Pseudonocardiaceae bacterium]|nr:tryptophan 2,3-dioxygenase family protein [Pseudonocardiaceae bacterium]